MKQPTPTLTTLNRAAERIEQFVQMIDGIAGETNRLALSGALDAARAGEAGEGFAAVAGATKTLSATAARATSSVDTAVRAIDGKLEVMEDLVAGQRCAGKPGAAGPR